MKNMFRMLVLALLVMCLGLVAGVVPAVAAPVGQVAEPTTCLSEDYTGTKLQWCQKICESGLTGAARDTWIHRWINRYRDLPYCLLE